MKKKQSSLEEIENNIKIFLGHRINKKKMLLISLIFINLESNISIRVCVSVL